MKGERMDRLLLVDGSNLLFQMFYGMPARIPGRDGRPVHGTLGFTGALLRVLRMRAPTHCVVFFDGEHENPRKALDEAYKANRPDFSHMEEQETPFGQLPDINRVLAYLGIPRMETTDCETDDLIAAYARRMGEKMYVDILSYDSDFFQLLSNRVSQLRYRGKLTVCWDPNTFREKFGIEPEQYADFKSLTGDASDNIRGAERVGPKTAAKLLRQHGTLEALLTGVEEISQPALRESILSSRERLLRNRALIRLEGTVPLPFMPEEMTFVLPEESSGSILRRLEIL